MADAVSQTSSDHSKNPSKIFSHFLYKAALVTLFLVLLPLFPSLAPEFVNQTLHARSWEFLQLIFVGIAVSYGLFSKKNDETEKDHAKIDNAQSYVSKLLQVSSVFEDESETPTVIDENNKVSTWSSQYYRGEPVVIKESKEENTVSVSSEIRQKPLLLPVRSLRQRVLDEPIEKSVDSIDGSGLKRFHSSNSRIFKKSWDFGGGVDSEKENEVLRSPIPWRSRSGRIEMKQNGVDDDDDSYVFTPTVDDLPEFNRSKKLSPSPSVKLPFSSEYESKSNEDVVRKKDLSPIPPPPPPPPFLRKSSSTVVKPNNTEKVFGRSFRSVPAEEFSESENDESPKTVMKLRDRVVEKDVRSVRTFKSTDNYEIDEKKEGIIGSSSDEESDEDEDDYFEGINSGVNVNSKVDDNNNNSVTVNEVGGGGPDVDKKADEFIAKFREQIRLQRIESIRKSTAQRAGKTSTLR